MALPADLLLGFAPAAHQIEGSVSADGRRPSIWTCCVPRGATWTSATLGAVACDHHRRWAAGVDRTAGLGTQAYRFSAAWPRTFPTVGAAQTRAVSTSTVGITNDAATGRVIHHLALGDGRAVQAVRASGRPDASDAEPLADPYRIDFLHDDLLALHRGLSAGWFTELAPTWRLV